MEKDLYNVGSIAWTGRDSQLSPLAGAGESYFYLGVNVGT